MMTDALDEDAYSSGSSPTDAHQAMNTLLTRVAIEVARRREDELPGLTETLQDSVLLTSGGTGRSADGWFEADAWLHGEQSVHELFLNADLSNHTSGTSSAEEVLVTLAHELCHVYARASEVKDTSRDGRYHNRKFAEIALQIGLRIGRDRQIGHHTPGLSARGRADYGDLLTELERGLVLRRAPLLVPRTKPSPPENGTVLTTTTGTPPSASTGKYVFASCRCQGARGVVTLRVSRGSWRPGIIRCTACGESFAESLTTDRQAGQGRR